MGVIQGELDFITATQGFQQLPKQLEFIRSGYKNAALVGGQGAAKTVALVSSAIVNALSDPNGMSLIGRLNMPALETSTMKTFLEVVPETEGQWHETKRKFAFKNGHDIIFRHLDIDDAKIKGHIKSLNLSAAFVDEGSEIDEEVYFLLLGRLRRKRSRRIFRLVSNPAGHDWIWRHFYDPNRKPELKETNQGIVVSSFDNPFLDDDYVENMLNTYPEDWAQRFIHGSFADFSDLVYKEFNEQTHVWDETKQWAVFNGPLPPKTWPVIIGMDIGSDLDPWSIVLIAIAPDGMLYQFDEIYGNSMLISNIAADIKLKLEGRRLEGLAFDYSNRQCALELADHGIWGQPAIKEVQPGLFHTNQFMHLDRRLKHPFNPAIVGSPRYFVASRCKNTIRELQEYKYLKGRDFMSSSGYNELDKDPAQSDPARRLVSHKSSHSPDAVRYALRTFRPLPSKQTPTGKWDNPTLDIQSKLFWQDEDKREKRLERLRARGPMKTMKEWQEESEKPPLRYQRFHNFTRGNKTWQNLMR